MRLLIVFILLSQFSFSQKIPMDALHWEYDTTTVKFITHRGVSAVQNQPNKNYNIFLKNHVFENGTIEFDVELTGQGFPGINFRLSDDKKYGERFYIRSFGPTTPHIRTTLQYAAVMDGLCIWDLTDEYQASATIYQEGWNHVKMVINGKQMRVYVNDMATPALIVPELESWRDSGSISLNGNVIYANFELKPNAVENLDPEAGYISAYNDTRYIRNWEVTEPVDFPFGRDIIMNLPGVNGDKIKTDLPDSTTVWTSLKAENRGIVNLSRKYGLTQRGERKLAWIKTTIVSNKEQERELSMGFSDEVWVFINGQILLVDKNYYGTPSQKEPAGWCTIENTSFKLSLKEGENEILIGVANYFYGWGIIAKLDNMDGLILE